MKRVLSFLLCLAIVVGFAPMMMPVQVEAVQAEQMEHTGSSVKHDATAISLDAYHYLTVGDETTEWLSFTTGAAGDYELTLDQNAYVDMSIYETSTEAYVDYFSFDEYTKVRVTLKANTQYSISVEGYETAAKTVCLVVTKSAKDVKKITISSQDDIILPEEGFLYEDEAYIYSYYVEDSFRYKVTYTDGTTQTSYYEDLAEQGIIVYAVQYAGKFHETDGFSYFKAGKQPVVVCYMNERTSSSYVKITGYVDWISEYHEAQRDMDTMVISYEDDEEHTYFWLIKPKKTELYDLYSEDWENIRGNIILFDEDDNIIVPKIGWCLEAGKEYCLRFNYIYNEGYDGDVEFWLEKSRDHTHKYSSSCDKSCNSCGFIRKVSHSYKTIVQTKATFTKNGKSISKCTKCGYVASKVKTIYKVSTVKLSGTKYTYNGKTKKPSVTVKDSAGNKLKEGTDYTVTYASGRKNVGTYKVTVKLKGKYSGTKVLTFQIVPKAASINKLTAKKKALTVKLNRQTVQSSGYQIQYSTSKTFKSYKTATITSNKTSTKTISGLKAKTTYYVRVRTYKTVNKTKIYSNWSSTKSMKTK